eukprot:TRINITY_DN18743_c0_g1_i1.p2 TRINITY_DN18743_c0_g1~~TRINITY_DN18743_c0_g1_i1.p2  ORF type:complete len:102 (-),score=23.19 TRINITY_DN18743_c0_g1_i1:439-744(-)
MPVGFDEVAVRLQAVRAFRIATAITAGGAITLVTVTKAILGVDNMREFSLKVKGAFPKLLPEPRSLLDHDIVVGRQEDDCEWHWEKHIQAPDTNMSPGSRS